LRFAQKMLDRLTPQQCRDNMCVPLESNFESLDAFTFVDEIKGYATTSRAIGLQLTTANRHSLRVRGLKRVMDAMNVRELVIFMVVPPSVYKKKTFAPVKLLAKKDTPTSMPTGYNIHVYMLEMPLDVNRLDVSCPWPRLLLPTGRNDDVKEVELTWLADVVGTTTEVSGATIPQDFDGYSNDPLNDTNLAESSPIELDE